MKQSSYTCSCILRKWELAASRFCLLLILLWGYDVGFIPKVVSDVNIYMCMSESSQSYLKNSSTSIGVWQFIYNVEKNGNKSNLVI